MFSIIKLPRAVVHALQESTTFPLRVRRRVDRFIHDIFSEFFGIHNLARVAYYNDIAR